jgi:hypothetical protein
MAYINTGCGGTGGGGGNPSYPGNNFEVFFRNSNTLASAADMVYDNGFLSSKGLKISSNVVGAPVDGQVWRDGNNLNARINSITFALTPPQLNGQIPRTTTSGGYAYVAEFRFDTNTLRAPNISVNSFSNDDARLDVFGGGTFADIITRFRAQPSSIWFDLRGNGNLGLGDVADVNARLKIKGSGGAFNQYNILAVDSSDNALLDVRNNGRIGLGTGAIDTARVKVAASTTGVATFNLTSGANVSSPNDGDLWYNGTNLYFRRGSTTFDLLVNIPIEQGWIPHTTDNAGNYAYNQYFKWHNGIMNSPTVNIGNGPAVTIVPNGSLLQMKSENNSWLIPAMTYENNAFGVRYDMRTNGNIGMGGAAVQHTRLNIIPDGGSALRINPGAPAAPVDGDVWVAGDKIFIRLAGVTKEFQFV